jgi:UDP-N-acetylglucosamine 2-epimerase (non-hydrolysing)
MRIVVAAGTGPEIIKLGPVVRALRKDDHDVRVVATGPHADPKVAAHVFDELDYQPDAVWDLPAAPGERVGAMLANAIEELGSESADALLVLGDTDTVPLMALAARRHRMAVIHVEAGLRSFNGHCGAEVNRRVMAATATLNLAPTLLAARFLLAEGVPAKRIRVVGNPIIDVLMDSGVPRCPLGDRTGVLFTAHHGTDVDRPSRLRDIVRLLAELGRSHGPVTFPMHPRTERRLGEAGLLERVTNLEGVRTGPPLAVYDLLKQLSGSRLVVTDSGGLQEEAAYFGLPVVIMRDTTPRWEGVQAGTAALCGVEPKRVLASVEGFLHLERLAHVDEAPCPYGTGDTGTRIANLLRMASICEILTPRECDLDLPGAELLAGFFDRATRG